jgi:hypothetical protein
MPNPYEQPLAQIELEPIAQNLYLPRPNVMPLTAFEMEELNRERLLPPNLCENRQKIHLPPINYYSEFWIKYEKMLVFFYLKNFFE